jgi:hypothetical protein
MKNILLATCIVVLLVHNVHAQYKTIHFMSERNPISKISSCLNKKIKVTGSIRETKSNSYDRILVIGKLGNSDHPPKNSTNFPVVIFNKDKYKFKNIKDIDLYHSYASIIGKVILYHGKLALQLRYFRDLDFDSTKDMPVVR